MTVDGAKSPRAFEDYAITYNAETDRFEGLLIAEADVKVPLRVDGALWLERTYLYDGQHPLSLDMVCGHVHALHPATFFERPAMWGELMFAPRVHEELLAFQRAGYVFGAFVHAVALEFGMPDAERVLITKSRITGFSIMTLRGEHPLCSIVSWRPPA